jgi:hypothetical protein
MRSVDESLIERRRVCGRLIKRRIVTKKFI